FARGPGHHTRCQPCENPSATADGPAAALPDQQVHRLQPAYRDQPSVPATPAAFHRHPWRNTTSPKRRIWSGNPGCRAGQSGSHAPRPAMALPATATNKDHSWHTSLRLRSECCYLGTQCGDQIINAEVCLLAPIGGSQFTEPRTGQFFLLIEITFQLADTGLQIAAGLRFNRCFEGCLQSLATTHKYTSKFPGAGTGLRRLAGIGHGNKQRLSKDRKSTRLNSSHVKI